MRPAASRMTDPPASSTHCASPPDLISAADARQANKTAIAETRSCLISLAPSIRQRRIAVENDLTRRQSALQLLKALFRHQRVVQVQRLQAGYQFQYLRTVVRDAGGIHAQFA